MAIKSAMLDDQNDSLRTVKEALAWAQVRKSWLTGASHWRAKLAVCTRRLTRAHSCT